MKQRGSYLRKEITVHRFRKVVSIPPYLILSLHFSLVIALTPFLVRNWNSVP